MPSIWVFRRIKVNNNDDERQQDRISLLKIPTGTLNNFSKNYRQFGDGSEKDFPALSQANSIQHTPSYTTYKYITNNPCNI
jgi:hypothetical protein